MTKRKYMTKAEAADRGLYVKTDLKNIFRLKPAPNQKPVDWIWSGWDCYPVYEKSLCIEMRPKRDLTDAQRASIERARDMVGTKPCARVGCDIRVDSGYEICPVCDLRRRKNVCAEMAKSWFDRDFVVVDTETNGLSSTSEVVEISVISSSGEVLLDSLLKPSTSITECATIFHGIKNSDVNNSPSWADIHEEVMGIFSSRLVISYNAGFNMRVIRRSAEVQNLEIPVLKYYCAMKLFSRYYGDMYGNDYRWKKLSFAAENLGINFAESHRSLADCKTTLEVAKKLSDLVDYEVCGWQYEYSN